MKSQEITYIALADDHALFRNGLAEIINSMTKDMSVMLLASNGQELIDALNSAEHLPDVCIIDINMPVMNGYQTASIIRQNWPQIKILAMSMHSHEFAVLDMIRKGACGYILKGAEPEELFTALNWIKEHGFYHNELVENHTTRIQQMPELKERELEFLTLCYSDLRYDEIAEKMDITNRTIEEYRLQLFKKLNIKTRAGLAVFASKIGLVQEGPA